MISAEAPSTLAWLRETSCIRAKDFGAGSGEGCASTSADTLMGWLVAGVSVSDLLVVGAPELVSELLPLFTAGEVFVAAGVLVGGVGVLAGPAEGATA
jgi:hypothetical protein